MKKKDNETKNFSSRARKQRCAMSFPTYLLALSSRRLFEIMYSSASSVHFFYQHLLCASVAGGVSRPRSGALVHTYVHLYVALSSFSLSAKQILMAVLDKTWVACVLGVSVPDLSTEPPRAGPHRVDSGRVAEPPRVGGQRTRTRKKNAKI